jgi:hypothetical protein
MAAIIDNNLREELGVQLALISASDLLKGHVYLDGPADLIWFVREASGEDEVSYCASCAKYVCGDGDVHILRSR